jgi:hypothetical protein
VGVRGWSGWEAVVEVEDGIAYVVVDEVGVDGDRGR